MGNWLMELTTLDSQAYVAFGDSATPKKQQRH